MCALGVAPPGTPPGHPVGAQPPARPLLQLSGPGHAGLGLSLRPKLPSPLERSPRGSLRIAASGGCSGPRSRGRLSSLGCHEVFSLKTTSAAFTGLHQTSCGCPVPCPVPASVSRVWRCWPVAHAPCVVRARGQDTHPAWSGRVVRTCTPCDCDRGIRASFWSRGCCSLASGRPLPW